MIGTYDPMPSMTKVRGGLGLCCALALLAACGPTKPSGEDLGEGLGEDIGDESDTSVPEAMCTLENYADDPGILPFTEVGCVPALADGTCAMCDDACAATVVTDCCDPPGPPCLNECSYYVVLCSEQLGDQCCHLVTADYEGAVPGRPLRSRGVALLPSVRFEASTPELDPHRAVAAGAYREFARYERASVDAFLQAAVVLEQLGAPAGLVADNREAAREEAEHARLALRAAESIDGRSATLGEVPSSSDAFELHAFVRDLIHDACFNEAVAAAEAGWALARPGVVERAALKQFWRTVSVDEAGHAALAWRTLEWLLATRPQLGDTVHNELRAAMTRPSDDPQTSHDHGLLEQAGIASSRTKAQLREQVITELLAEAQLQRAVS